MNPVPTHTPVPFITELDGQFALSPEAKRILSSIKGRVSVVAVAGLYRTGKSFLLNSLLGLNGSTSSFVVGNTVAACTKGLWLWGEPVELPDGSKVLFIDSEGLGSTDRSHKEDVQIFSLAVLLSSFFIWNSRGVIDGSAIEDFGLVVGLAKNMQKTAGAGAIGASSVVGSHGDQDGGRQFPSFMWVVRDFTLKLERNGTAIDDRQYLEDALKAQAGSGNDARNEIRNIVCDFFRARDCVTLVRPAADESMLRNLSAQPASALRPEFNRAMQGLKAKVFSQLRPKSLYGKVVTGPMLATLSETYCQSLNSGGVPTLASAWERVLGQQAKESAAKATSAYVETVARALGLEPTILGRLCEKAHSPPAWSNAMANKSAAYGALPVESESLDAIHSDAKAAALDCFHSGLWDLGRGIFTEGAALTRVLTEHRTAVRAVNAHLSLTHCTRLASSLSAELLEFGGGSADKSSEASEACCHGLVSAYEAAARGPAKSQVLAALLAGPMAAAYRKWLAQRAAVDKRAVRQARADVADASEAAHTLAGKLDAEKDAAAKEAAAQARAAADAEQSAAADKAVECAKLESKRSEAARARASLAALESAYDVCLSALGDVLDADQAAVADLHATYMRLQTENTAPVVQEERRGPRSGRSGGELSDNGQSVSEADVVLSRREFELLEQHVTLLQRNVATTTEVIHVKEGEVQEREFQWGMAKAGLAHQEGEAMTLEEETSVLRSLAAKLKGHLQNRLTRALPADLLKELSPQQIVELSGLT